MSLVWEIHIAQIFNIHYIVGLEQNRVNPIVNALELLELQQPYAKSVPYHMILQTIFVDSTTCCGIPT